MAEASWYDNLKQVLFTHFKTRVTTLINDSSKKVYFTLEGNNTEPTKFPTIYFEELTPIERGMTLNNTDVNALSETIQITVYSDNRREVKSLMVKSLSAMKSMRFNITGFPLYETNHDIKFGVARFRRTIGCDDTF